MAANIEKYMKRWDDQVRSLPDLSNIQRVNVFDFDNTLFQTPLPNTYDLWDGATIRMIFSDSAFGGKGGWWHDPRILAATGEGPDVEENRAWEGHWNEDVVDRVRSSMADKHALTVLLTGRGRKRYTPLLSRILNSKKLEFDVISLKPSMPLEQFETTLEFKKAFLADTLRTFPKTQSIKVYEDRPHHATAFREFLEGEAIVQNSVGEEPLEVEVIDVPPTTRYLPKKKEIELIQSMVNDNNREAASPWDELHVWKGRTLFTGYLLTYTDKQRLLKHFTVPPIPEGDEGRWSTYADHITITPKPSHPNWLLKKTGGLGYQLEFETVARGLIKNRVFAVKVEPVDKKAPFYTVNNHAHITIAARRDLDAKPFESNTITHWEQIPQEERLRFIGTVGEKAFWSVNEGTKPTHQTHGFRKRFALEVQDEQALRKKSFAERIQQEGESPIRPRNGEHRGERGGQRGGFGRGRGGREGGRGGSRGGFGGGPVRFRGRGRGRGSEDGGELAESRTPRKPAKDRPLT
ncbi:hypothetical protein YB2330_006051 [Saitoella coloradoensis]